MTNPATATRQPASRLSLAAFLLALLTTATTALVAAWWAPVDDRFVDAADNAGWDESLLLPHQMGLTMAIDGAVVLSVVLSVLSLLALLRARRTGWTTT